MSPLEHGEIKVKVSVSEAGAELARMVEWVLTDMVYTAPEDSRRKARQFHVLRDALDDWKEARDAT